MELERELQAARSELASFKHARETVVDLASGMNIEAAKQVRKAVMGPMWSAMVNWVRVYAASQGCGEVNGCMHCTKSVGIQGG